MYVCIMYECVNTCMEEAKKEGGRKRGWMDGEKGGRKEGKGRRNRWVDRGRKGITEKTVQKD